MVFSSSFRSIARSPHLKTGVMYRYFWDIDDGAIIKPELSRFNLVPVKSFIDVYDGKILKKGELDDEYILVELEDIESFTGRILNEHKVTEIGSDKILFGDCDFLFSKIRPYLGKVAFNERHKPYIGSTELVPFIIDHHEIVYGFIRNLLLSRLFIEKCSLLMYGKEHPRIAMEDFLEIKVPIPPFKEQKRLVDKLHPIENKIQALYNSLVTLQSLIEETLLEYSIKKSICQPLPDWFVFTSCLSDVVAKQNFRLGAQYGFFWHKYQGSLFDNDCVYPQIPLSNLIFPMEEVTVFKKGELDDEYLLVNLEHIEQKCGKVSNYEVVSEIGSDKILLDGADLVIAKIDPYLGHIFLNEPEKPFIGSTEFIPLKVNKNKIIAKYIRYLLLSNEYLTRSSLLMYGKRHPRIHSKDLLDIRVPLPSKSIQRKIVSELEHKEDEFIRTKNKIAELNDQKKNAFWTFLKKPAS